MTGKFNTFIKFYLVSVIISLLLLQIPFIHSFLNRVELFLNDIHFNVKDYDAKKIDSVVVIDIDEKSINKLGRFSSWPLQYYAMVVDAAKYGGAKYIAFDMFFTENDKLSKNIINLYTNKLKDKFNVDSTTISEIISSLDTEDSFAKSLIAANNVILASFDDFNVTEFSEVELPNNLTTFNIDTTKYLPKFKKLNSPNFPIPSLANSTYKLGFAHISPDDDGTTRHYDTFFIYGNKLVVNFSMQCVIDLLKVDSVSFSKQYAELFSKSKKVLSIPIDENGKTILNYYGIKKQFRYISFYNVVRNRIDPSYFKDKIVLIGSSAIGLRDLKTIPIDDNYPGIELHATFIYNAITNNFINKPSVLINYISWVLFLTLCMLIFYRFEIIWNLLIFPIISFLVLAVSHVLFEQYNLLLEQSILLMFEFFAFIGILIFKYQTEYKEKQRIKKTFEKYVSGSIINEMLNHPEKLTLGGEIRNVTALFSDIQNFTTISEKITPSELTEFLKKYMTELTQIVYDRGGMLDKYIGDAIVALFGVPVNIKNHPVAACECVLEMRNRSRKIIAESTNEVFRGIRTRFGLNTGSMICGNMGSEQLFDYTGIGDNMNLAARLESINKVYGTEIVISESTRNLLPNNFIVRELDRVAVKGKSKGVVIYELVGKKEEFTDLESIYSKINIYELALSNYYLGKWDDALLQINNYLEILPEDLAAITIKKRIEYYKNTPPDNWDGVCKMEFK
ncbi:MAG TPA: adenylate/guanylate cyclase domain-containing protein [Melioribacteraceae bacterium]|nr:adenylate/guanylate cyclase domain-containing protein [Melioribacteraceae bacterium]